MEQQWPPDPLLDEVDQARLRILAEHGNDRRKVWESYMAEQEQYADRLIRQEEGTGKDKSAV